MTLLEPHQPPRLSGLCLFVAAYVSLFAIAGVLLFGPGIFPRHAAVVSVSDTEGLRWPYTGTQLINCSSLRDVTQLEFIAGGWTKAVYRGRYNERLVAVKTVNLNGHDLQECQGRGELMAVCYRKAAAKIIKEMILLTELPHQNIVKVLGSCVPDALGPVAMVTELGEPLDTVKLLQLSWEDRLHLALGIARILHLLAHSPLGSLAMNDFRRQQFVLVDGALKLSDVDDVGVDEPTCDTSEDCLRMLPEELRNVTLELPMCERERCTGHNERVNVWRAGKHFIRQFLPLSAPAALEPHITELLAAYSDASWSAVRILSATQQLVQIFASGEYLTSTPPSLDGGSHTIPGFDVIQHADLPGQFDYACSESRSVVTCVRSVYDASEAAALCASDPRCQSVVMGQTKTWTGRTLAVFKTGYAPHSYAAGHTLLVKH